MAMNLKLEILRALHFESRSLLLPRKTLLNQVRAVMDPVPTQSEFADALGVLEEKRLVVSVRDELEETNLKYRLTDAGRAEVAARA